MTDVSKKILSDYQIRNKKAQKTAFIDFLRDAFPELRVEECGTFHSRNLVIGEPDTAKLILTAHYDTCPVLPFPNFLTPKNIPVYILYNLLLLLPLFLFTAGVAYLVHRLTNDPTATSRFGALAYFAGFGVMLFILYAGKPNRHTVNDNTSGVVTLCELLAAMDEETRRQTAFVFFDHEENGMIGSSAFKKLHKNAIRDTLLVNLDCVSDGDTLMIIQNKRARTLYGEQIARAFTGVEGKNILLEKASTTLYPSDQSNFACNAAVAAFHRSRIFGYYLDKIHTDRDTVCDERNIDYLRDRICRLARDMASR